MKFALVTAALLLSSLSLSVIAGDETEFVSTKQSFKGYDIELLENCGVQTPEPSKLAYVVMHDQINTLRGWSHVKKDKENGEYSSLKLEDVDYAISKQHYQQDESCNGVKTQKGVLVFKYSDWDRQHSNGFEPKFFDKRLALGNIEKIVLELKINSADTTIPTLEQLHATYDKYLTEEQFADFDNAKVNLGISIWEASALNQSIPSLNADMFVEIDQQTYFDKWLRITIPVESMNYFTELSYIPTPANKDDYKELAIKGLRINPENLKGNQVRNYLLDDWSYDIPETFKEISLNIKSIQLIVKDNDVNYF